MTTEELDRALRQLRLGGMADTVSVRAQQARADNLGPLDFLNLLVHDEFRASKRSPCRTARQERGLPRSKDARHLRLEVQQLDRSRANLRARHRTLRRAAARLPYFRKPREREVASLAGHRHGGHPRRIPCALSRGTRALRRARARSSVGQSPSSDRGLQRDSVADHRRFGYAQTADGGRGRFARDRDATLRTRLDDDYVESTT